MVSSHESNFFSFFQLPLFFCAASNATVKGSLMKLKGTQHGLLTNDPSVGNEYRNAASKKIK